MDRSADYDMHVSKLLAELYVESCEKVVGPHTELHGCGPAELLHRSQYSNGGGLCFRSKYQPFDF